MCIYNWQNGQIFIHERPCVYKRNGQMFIHQRPCVYITGEMVKYLFRRDYVYLNEMVTIY